MLQVTTPFLIAILCASLSSAQTADFAELLAQAHAGSGPAAYALGKQYEFPLTQKPPNFSGAAYWYNEASNRGVPEASVDLARFYLTGLGVSRDDTKALQLLETAAEAGYPLAMTRLGEMMIAQHYRGNGEYFGRPWIQKAADAGEPDALNDLGWMAMKTPVGVAPPVRDALSYFSKAAGHGSCPALLNIGNLYLHGSFEYNFAQDAAEAQRWFAKVQSCPTSTPDLKQQAAELAQRTARGEMPPLSKEEPIVSSSERMEAQRTMAAIAATISVLGLLVLMHRGDDPSLRGPNSPACRAYKAGLGGSQFTCIPMM